MLENSYVYPDNNAHVSVANDNRNRGCYRIQDGQTHYFQATCELHRDYRVYRGWHFGKSLGKIRATPAAHIVYCKGIPIGHAESKLAAISRAWEHCKQGEQAASNN